MSVDTLRKLWVQHGPKTLVATQRDKSTHPFLADLGEDRDNVLEEKREGTPKNVP
jgi:hypothetical protein